MTDTNLANQVDALMLSGPPDGGGFPLQDNAACHNVQERPDEHVSALAAASVDRTRSGTNTKLKWFLENLEARSASRVFGHIVMLGGATAIEEGVP